MTYYNHKINIEQSQSSTKAGSLVQVFTYCKYQQQHMRKKHVRPEVLSKHSKLGGVYASEQSYVISLGVGMCVSVCMCMCCTYFGGLVVACSIPPFLPSYLLLAILTTPLVYINGALLSCGQGSSSARHQSETSQTEKGKSFS